MTSPSLLHKALTLWALLVVAAAADVPRPDPFIDPSHDPYNPLRYIASNVLTSIAFALVLVVGILQVCCIFRWGAKWMLSMTIGSFAFALGLCFRYGLHAHPQSRGQYIMESLFVVLSPCAFIAADYVLLGRLARHLNANQYLLVEPRRITIVFVFSDISTFLIQAAGGGLASSNDPTQSQMGTRVFLVGLAAQLLSFIIFSAIYIVFLHRVRKQAPDIWRRDVGQKWYQSWRTLAAALSISCIGILIRSSYRVVELSQGFEGPLATSEASFYCLDTLPLFISIVIYVPFWPGRFIPDTPSPTEMAHAGIELDPSNSEKQLQKE